MCRRLVFVLVTIAVVAQGFLLSNGANHAFDETGKNHEGSAKAAKQVSALDLETPALIIDGNHANDDVPIGLPLNSHEYRHKNGLPSRSKRAAEPVNDANQITIQIHHKKHNGTNSTTNKTPIKGGRKRKGKKRKRRKKLKKGSKKGLKKPQSAGANDTSIGTAGGKMPVPQTVVPSNTTVPVIGNIIEPDPPESAIEPSATSSENVVPNLTNSSLPDPTIKDITVEPVSPSPIKGGRRKKMKKGKRRKKMKKGSGKGLKKPQSAGTNDTSIGTAGVKIPVPQTIVPDQVPSTNETQGQKEPNAIPSQITIKVHSKKKAKTEKDEDAVVPANLAEGDNKNGSAPAKQVKPHIIEPDAISPNIKEPNPANIEQEVLPAIGDSGNKSAHGHNGRILVVKPKPINDDTPTNGTAEPSIPGPGVIVPYPNNTAIPEPVADAASNPVTIEIHHKKHNETALTPGKIPATGQIFNSTDSVEVPEKTKLPKKRKKIRKGLRKGKRKRLKQHLNRATNQTSSTAGVKVPVPVTHLTSEQGTTADDQGIVSLEQTLTVNATELDDLPLNKTASVIDPKVDNSILNEKQKNDADIDDDDDDKEEEEDDDLREGPVPWSKLTEAKLKSYRDGFTPGAELEDLIPAAVEASGDVQAAVEAASADCGEDDTCFWDNIYDRSIPTVSQAQWTIIGIFSRCSELKGKRKYCPDPCRPKPCALMKNVMLEGCTKQGYGLYTSDYMCSCDMKYVWDPVKHLCHPENDGSSVKVFKVNEAVDFQPGADDPQHPPPDVAVAAQNKTISTAPKTVTKGAISDYPKLSKAMDTNKLLSKKKKKKTEKKARKNRRKQAKKTSKSNEKNKEKSKAVKTKEKVGKSESPKKDIGEIKNNETGDKKADSELLERQVAALVDVVEQAKLEERESALTLVLVIVGIVILILALGLTVCLTRRKKKNAEAGGATAPLLVHGQAANGY